MKIWEVGKIPLSAWCRHRTRLFSTTNHNHNADQQVVKIGGVSILQDKNTARPDLVPNGIVRRWGGDITSTEVVSHLRWLAQKYLMGQDAFLLGPPSPLRRRLALTFAELLNKEVEFLTITKDTTESDLKQRREIVGSSVIFSDQAPVKAAINGRILILDGIENAERNVLPTLNNLLENREMALEDGRFLMPASRIEKLIEKHDETVDRLVPVAENFRVIALGLPVPPFPGRTLDPPLRSRFQSRFVEELSVNDALTSIFTSGQIPQDKLSMVGAFYEGLSHLRHEAMIGNTGISMIPTFSLDNLSYCLQLLLENPNMSWEKAVIRAFPLGYSLDQSFNSRGSALTGITLAPQIGSMMQNLRGQQVDNHASLVHDEDDDETILSTFDSLTKAWFTDHQKMIINDVSMDLSSNKHVCILGSKGCGKSYMLNEILGRFNIRNEAEPEGNSNRRFATIRIMPLYQEMTARDLLQRRSTASSTSDSGNGQKGQYSSTTWQDSPLIKAAKNGDICVLDGIDRIDPHSLFVLRRLLQDQEIELPSGDKLQIHAKDESLMLHPNFRVIALGLPPVRPDDARARYLMSDLGFTYHYLQSNNTAQDISKVLENSHPTEGLTAYERYLVIFVGILHDIAYEHPELRVSMLHALRCQSILKKMDEETINDGKKHVNSSDVIDVLSETLLVRFLSKDVAAKFYEAVENFNTINSSGKLANGSDGKAEHTQAQIEETENVLTIGNISVNKRIPSLPELVPDPVFFENASQSKVLESMLRSYTADGENGILLIGNQGVGKNKLIDRLLFLLNAEREYVQVHRDTTIQSLTLLPFLDSGKIVYEDSPLVRAVQTGRVLVLDEVDKAPLEVVCVLKGLIGDGELVLYDGRRILSCERAMKEYAISTAGSGTSDESLELRWSFSNEDHAALINIYNGAKFQEFCSDNEIVPIHPNFKLFCLANRPGHPFLGNHFFKECGDLFVVHVVENLDRDSEISLLKAFAPGIDSGTLTSLSNVFADLRMLNDQGILAYPFSAREAVALAKHFGAYPSDKIEGAAENILGFEGMNVSVRETIAQIFRKHGFDVPQKNSYTIHSALLDEDGNPLRVIGGNRGYGEDAQSNPKFETNMPKHGKVDPENQPHVGGNTWAGGSGGSDTAGLGGRGGPYRLDSGHQVHQISDEEKARVSDESKRKANEMAKEAFRKKLEEIGMGQNDYENFQRFSGAVQTQVEQMKDLLDEVCRRGRERVWLRNQSGGDLDDGKIVDGLSGERNIYKKRAFDNQGMIDDNQNENPVKTKVQFVVDVSGSMIRFNGLDRRLERMLETTLMIMQSLPRPPSKDGETTGIDGDDLSDLLEYSIMGHSGETADRIFIDFPSNNKKISESDNINEINRYGVEIPNTGKLNERMMMQILEEMIAHSQFCWSGDNTLPATEIAIDRASTLAEEEENVERLVIVITDANFGRYRISSEEVSRAMRKSPHVNTHMVMIAGLRDEAEEFARELPVGKAHICRASSDLPSILRQILTSSMEL